MGKATTGTGSLTVFVSDPPVLGGAAGAGSLADDACDLMNGTKARAASTGVWKRRAGSLAIIRATTAASSAGVPARDRWRGVASVDTWAWRMSKKLFPGNGGAPVSRK